jgi:hypothetical protein
MSKFKPGDRCYSILEGDVVLCKAPLKEHILVSPSAYWGYDENGFMYGADFCVNPVLMTLDEAKKNGYDLKSKGAIMYAGYVSTGLN